MRGKKGKRANGEGTCKQLPNGRYKATYTVGRTPDGKLIRKSVNGKSQEEALRLMKERQVALAHGRPVVSGNETVGHYLERWLEDRARPAIRESTYIRHRNVIRSMEPHIGHIRLRELKPGHIQAMFAAMHGQYAPATIARVHGVLSTALKGAVEWELIDRNPAQYARPPRVEKITRNVLSREECEQLFRAVDGTLYYPILVVLATLGLRKGEAFGLRWTDYVDGELLIRQGKTPAAERAVPVTEQVAAVLSRWKLQQLEMKAKNRDVWVESGYLFTTATGRQRHISDLDKPFKRALTAAGLPLMRLHDLRRTAIILMREAGVELDVVRRWIGHKRLATTVEVYGTVNRRRMTEAAKQLSAYMREVG